MASVHASTVLVGARAGRGTGRGSEFSGGAAGVLVRGPSGAGKSALVLRLLQAADAGALDVARLVADDRTLLTPAHGRLLARPVPQLAGMLEVRGLGVIRLPHEPVVALALVVDLAAAAERLPTDLHTSIEGVRLWRLALAPGHDPLPLLLAFLAYGHSRVETGSVGEK